MKNKAKFKHIIISFAVLAAAAASVAITYGKMKNFRQQKLENNYKVVKIMGGLGNQMFQYAFGLALARKSNCNVYYDLSFYDEGSQSDCPTVVEILKNKDASNLNAKREFCLKYFDVSLKCADAEKIESCSAKFNESDVKSRGISGFNNGCHEYFSGYFETLEHFDFEEFRDLFTKEFSLKVDMDEKNKSMLENIRGIDSVSIHIRRTDHQGGSHKFTGLNYYYGSVNIIKSKVKDPHFFVFSDDIDWSKENLKIDCPCTFVDINDDSTNYFDFELMKNCKHHIIANSTFSWWAAWLDPSKEKIVIAPSPWSKVDARDYMMPKDWIRVQDIDN